MEKVVEIEQLKARLAELEAETEMDNEMTMEDPIADADFTEDTEEEVKMRTVIYLGQSDDGELLFTVSGDKNLLIIDGLISYAKREMDRIWEAQMYKNENREPQLNQEG